MSKQLLILAVLAIAMSNSHVYAGKSLRRRLSDSSKDWTGDNEIQRGGAVRAHQGVDEMAALKMKEKIQDSEEDLEWTNLMYSRIMLATSMPGDDTPSPTMAPTTEPSEVPSAPPSTSPTVSPTNPPSPSPTSSPTTEPSEPPSLAPTQQLTGNPSAVPSATPSVAATDEPTAAQSSMPSSNPTFITPAPTALASLQPTDVPSPMPSSSPTDMTPAPTAAPSSSPSASPTNIVTPSPTGTTTTPPTVTPSSMPSSSPTALPTFSPTAAPTVAPTVTPTAAPTANPTATLTASPTVSPTRSPSSAPSSTPQPTTSFTLSYLTNPGICAGGNTAGFGCADDFVGGGNPNDLVNCFSVSEFGASSPFTIHSVRFWIGDSIPVPADLSIRVWTDVVDGAPGDSIALDQALSGYVTGENEFELSFPMTITSDEVCVGVFSGDLSSGLRLQNEPGDGSNSFILAPTCGVTSMSSVASLGFNLKYCLEALIFVA